MTRKIYCLSIGLALFLTAPTFAAYPVFGTDTSKPAGTASPMTGHVLSGEEFSQRVNSLNQQTKTNLAKQASDALPKAAQPLTAATPPPASPPTQPAVATPETPATPAPTNQTYTGFGTGNANTTSSTSKPSSAPKQSGWDIKY